MSAGPRVAVVGAGIVGTSVAYHLAARGTAVTLVDAAEPASGVTRRSFAWLNVAHTEPLPYQALRQSALDDWHRVEEATGGAVSVDWCGALTWEKDLADTERLATHHAAAGYDVRLLSRAQIAELEPGLIEPPALAAHAPGEGAVDPVATTRALVAAARGAGAETRFGARALGLLCEGDRVTGVAVEDGQVRADAVVLAAGLGSVDLANAIGIALPVSASPATLVRMRADRPLVRGILSSPGFEIRQIPGGGLLAAESYVDDSPENGPEAAGRRLVEAVRAGLRGAETVSLIDAVPGWRPMPEDGGPIVGRVASRPGLYLAAMHAGVILAPTIGRLLTEEILDGTDAPALAPCRLARFHV